MSGKEDIEKEISFSHSDHPTAIKRDSIHQHLQDDAERYTSSLLSETDDPTLPTLTFRAWVLGTFWCNQCPRPMADSSSHPIVSTLLSYPMGVLMAKTLPTHKFRTFGWEWSFNPGPFSLKEHVLISIMGSCGAAGAYGIENVATQKFRLFMGNDKITFLEAFGWVMATQFIGFGLAGLCRRFLVKPKAMMWPSTFGSIALYVSLHKPDLPIGRWRMPRFTFFWIVLTVIFAYTWIPQFFAQFLQAVSILCFFSSNYANWLGSAQRGLGVLAFTFDWYYMFGSMLGNVLTIPFVYMANNIAGYILFDWILVPIFAHINPFGHPELTIPGDVNFDGTRFDNQVTSKLFNKTGNQIDAVSLYDSTTFDLDVGKFDDNKPIFITDMFALNYFSSFLVLTAMFSHIALWHGKQIVRQFRAALKQIDTPEDGLDIHNKLMKAYPEVPEWMYLAFLLVCTAGMCFVGAFTPFVMPWWSVLLAVLIAAVTILPTGIIFAITGTQIGLNVLSELVIGFIAPGQTVTVMAFKSLSYNCQIQAFGLVSDLKISHYLKIPPRAMVIAQLYSTAIGSISTLVVTWLVMTTSFADTIGNNPDWTASSTYAVYYNAGAIWGAISPARFFGSDSPYFALLLGFPIGLVVPFIPWLLYKAYPSKFWLWINVPLILYVNSAGQLQTLIVVPFIVSWFFNYYLFNKHNDWWRKYMYVFAGATSAGVALCVVAIAILYNFTGAITPPNWTGNPVGDLFLRSWC